MCACAREATREVGQPTVCVYVCVCGGGGGGGVATSEAHQLTKHVCMCEPDLDMEARDFQHHGELLRLHRTTGFIHFLFFLKPNPPTLQEPSHC